MISNPVRVFISGNDQKSFTYEGGERLWHFSPHDCGLSKTMEMNVVFFANDGQHALSVVKRMLEFLMECHTLRGQARGLTHEEVEERRLSNMGYVTYLLENEDKWIVTLAPTDQLFKVGWADNDTM